MFAGGGGFGGPMGGRPAGPGQAGGLPFSGIPPEMQAGVEKLLVKEPEHPDVHIPFSHVTTTRERTPFSLSQLLRPKWFAMAVGVIAVALETVSLQIGPILTQRAIDKGMIPRNFRVVLIMAIFYLGSIVVNGVISAWRVSWTGRMGQGLMYDLRVRVFSHIQRLSLDFFTDEKAGRIMTRMTSDVEALADLLQDGLINLIVQAFTLVFVVIVLFTYDVKLAAIVVLAIVPVMTIMTLWFRAASERTYEQGA